LSNDRIVLCIGLEILLLAIMMSLLLTQIIRRYLHRQFDAIIKRLVTEPYGKNLWEGITGIRHMGIQWMMENELRSTKAEALPKPIGTHRPFPHFDGLLLNPVQLHRRPVEEFKHVDLQTVLGKKSKRPLVLTMPIIVSAMPYGVALSKPFSFALAKGTALVGTAFNTGEGPVLSEHREFAHRMIIQYHAAPWSPKEDVIKQADMIEIRFGQGANGGNGALIPTATLPPEVLHDMGLASRRVGEFVYIPAGIPGIHRARHLKRLVETLRFMSHGVPIALKLAASHYLEFEMEIAVKSGVDVVVIDGAQGGTHSSPAILTDDFGLPTLSALCRAVRFLKESGYSKNVDLVISGGIRTPGDILKALALGANAVYLGSAALFAATHAQLVETLPFQPPTQIAWADGVSRSKFDVKGAQSLANFLKSSSLELETGIRALGKTSVRELTREDLVAWDPDVARITHLPLV
jgi:methylamine---glutamate N-methyltransferase subunit C